MFPGLPAGFDPSKLDPKLISEISELMGTLPPEMMMKMQTLMHNSMAGHDVRKDMEEFERGLPPGFREKMARIMYQANGVVDVLATPATTPTEPTRPLESLADARYTILNAVKNGTLTPEAAMKALFD